MTKDPFSIDISLRHPSYKAERIARVLSITPKGSYSAGTPIGKRKAKRTFVYACLQQGDYASEFERALFKVISFMKKNEAFWTDFVGSDGEVKLILNHAVSPGWKENDNCFELSLAPAFLGELSDRGIGLRVQGWWQEKVKKRASAKKRARTPKRYAKKRS